MHCTSAYAYLAFLDNARALCVLVVTRVNVRAPARTALEATCVLLAASTGGAVAFGSATEHQGVGTPHVHGQIHLCCAYQYKLLSDIAAEIRAGLLDAQSILDFNAWFHREDPPDQELHNVLLPIIEQA